MNEQPEKSDASNTSEAEKKKRSEFLLAQVLNTETVLENEDGDGSVQNKDEGK